MASPQAFFAGIGGGFLDRKNNERDNPEFIKELLSGPTDPECFLFFGTSPLLLTVTTNAQPTPVSVAYSWSLRDLLSDKLIDIGAPNTLFLGLRSAGAPVFASLALDDKKVIAFASSHGRKRAEQGEKVVGATFADNPQFFRVAPDIDSQDAAILGLVFPLFSFSVLIFCRPRVCFISILQTYFAQNVAVPLFPVFQKLKLSSLSLLAPCGTKRICKGTNPAITCKTDHFPKTEPIAIMLVIHPTKDQILLGRKASYLKSKALEYTNFSHVRPLYVLSRIHGARRKRRGSRLQRSIICGVCSNVPRF